LGTKYNLRKRLGFSLVLAGLFARPLLAQTVAESFVTPPAEARPMVRWWWFGPAARDAEIVREIKAMKAGGYGGFEIQPVYPLSLEGNTPYLSDAFLGSVRLANDTGRGEGMRVDMTLGSGWPFGGPHISADNASARLKLLKLSLPARAKAVDLPALKAGESVIAAFVGADMASGQPVDLAKLKPAPQDRNVFVVLQSPTGQQVKRASVGAEGYVLDHMSAEAVQTHLHAVGDKLMRAFGDTPPYSVFSDSLEVYGADWTDDVLAVFKARRGYDLKPHLLKLFDETPDSAAIRYDWGLTLSELTEDRYLKPAVQWARAHNTRFRSQTYGFPPVTLSSNRLVDLAEGEGAGWRVFTSTRWASSANHVYGKPVTSAESWTWLHQGAFQATPLDIKAEADTLLLQGVNQFIAHGWPYSPPDVPEPGWALYAAAVFNDHNPWWGVMPEVNLYLQRMSFVLRQGEPVADVAIYLPQADAFAHMTPGKASVNEQMREYVTDRLTTQILDAGYNFDYVDDEALKTQGFKHKVLILPHVSRIDPDTYKRIDAFARSGGIVIAVDKTPDTGTGLIDADTDAQAVRFLSGALFGPGVGPGHQAEEADLGQALKALTPSDLTGAPPEVGFVHRKLADGDLYFVANTSNVAVTAPLGFRTGKSGQWWDPRDGTTHVWAGEPVTLAPYESRLFVFGTAASAKPQVASLAKPQRRELSEGWTMAFKGKAAMPVKTFGSWTDDPATAYYSGVVTYSRNVKLTKADIAAGLTRLSFGEGDVVPPVTGRQNGTRALLTPPVREAAEVFVNGKRAGSVWTAPFAIDLKAFLKPGANQIDIRVANTAVNDLASRPPVDYTALNAKYGERFKPQGMDNLKPLPSGILKTPVLETAQ
jgi:hypothetical protein